MIINRNSISFANTIFQNNGDKSQYVKIMIDNIKATFNTNPAYFPVTKYPENTILYDAWILKAKNSTIDGIDMKKIIFKPDQTLNKGDLINWVNSIWLVSQLDPNQYYYDNGNMERCNNTLNWIDENENTHIEPCVIDYKISRDRILLDDIPQLQGDVIVSCQGNINTKTIKYNQRFIFNGTPFKIQSMRNYLRQTTLDKNDVPVIYFGMYKDVLASDDDLVNNIANTKQYQYTLQINQSNFSGKVGDIGQLTATVKLNGNTVSKNLQWISSDITIATIDNNGNYNLLKDGNATFTCQMADNNLINNNINVTVSDSVVINNNINKIELTAHDEPSNTADTIYLESYNLYSVCQYVNGVANNNTFTYTQTFANDNTRNKYYTFTAINGNNFKIENNCMSYNRPLTITCTNARDNSTVSIIINLKGVA